MKTRFFVPEVIQTSAMDCGPASLKSLLDGLGTPVHYGHLREFCQTDLDGSSIDTLEVVANELGVRAEQIMVPVDHVFLPEANTLPCILVIVIPSGLTHFVVAWRRHGPFVQVMDPAIGRRWPSAAGFLRQVYAHTATVPATGWREWARSSDFTGALKHRIRRLGFAGSAPEDLVAAALEDPDWKPIAALDATVRMVDSLVTSKALPAGKEAFNVLEGLLKSARSGEPTQTIPSHYWTVLPEDEDNLRFRGAVLVRALGPKAAEESTDTAGQATPPAYDLASVRQRSKQPGKVILGLFKDWGSMPFAISAAILLAAASGRVLEALLFRGLFDMGNHLKLFGQRLEMISALTLVLVLLMLLDFLINRNIFRFSRKLETELRVAFYRKIPRLDDRYFKSRLVSDMAERSHSIHALRSFPPVASQILGLVFEILVTTIGILWLGSHCAAPALLLVALAFINPTLSQKFSVERDLQLKTYAGALSRYYLDALLGFFAIRAQRAERMVRQEHENLLLNWAHANVQLLRRSLLLDGTYYLLSFAIAAWLVTSFIASGGSPGSLLLLTYWTLNLHTLGAELIVAAEKYPPLKNTTVRLVEPLESPEEISPGEDIRGDNPSQSAASGASISMEGVSVKAAGHTILENINLCVKPGQHMAVLGRSGAGKSTLLGLLLGWSRPSSGIVSVDGLPLGGQTLEEVRKQTAWVDPAVQLWNKSVLENLQYGTQPGQSASLMSLIAQSELINLLEELPQGLQTPLGEGGALVSGGEGQRVRLARAMNRRAARLIILDEPFRGLDRPARKRLLAQSRELWSQSTLLCVTHDVEDIQDFDHLLILENGTLAESGAPKELAEAPDSLYRKLLEANNALKDRLWGQVAWRRFQLEDGEPKEIQS